MDRSSDISFEFQTVKSGTCTKMIFPLEKKMDRSVIMKGLYTCRNHLTFTIGLDPRIETKFGKSKRLQAICPLEKIFFFNFFFLNCNFQLNRNNAGETRERERGDACLRRHVSYVSSAVKAVTTKGWWKMEMDLSPLLPAFISICFS